MGWTVSPHYLGYFLYSCTLQCGKTGVAANPELWQMWCKRCGKEGEEAVLALGKQARLLQCTIGPLHVFLNSVSDLQKQHSHFINRFYQAFTGQAMYASSPAPRTHTFLVLFKQRRQLGGFCVCARA